MEIKKLRTLDSPLRIFFAGLFLCLPVIVLTSNAQGPAVDTGFEAKLAETAADTFVSRYRKTMDLGPIIDDMRSSAIVQGLRKNDFFNTFGFDPELVTKLDDETVYNAYKSTMNVYFIGAVYNVFVPDDLPESQFLPTDVMDAISKSRVGKILIDCYARDVSCPPSVESESDLVERLRLNSEISSLLRRHIPIDPFNSAIYKKEYARQHKPVEIGSSQTSEKFGLGTGTRVYLAHRDFFNLYFVKEGNQMKLLFVG